MTIPEKERYQEETVMKALSDLRNWTPPSILKISVDTGMGMGTVEKICQRLRDKGIINYQRRVN